MRGLLFIVLLAACGGDDDSVAISDVDARVSPAIATVVTVTWKTDVPAIAHVQYGPTSDCELSTPPEAEPSTSHEAVLLGLAADSEWFYEVVAEAGDARAETAVATIATGPLPADLPVLTSQGDGNDRFVVTSLIGVTSAAVILDPQGRIVWYSFDSRGLSVYRARLSRDGRSVLYNAANVSGEPAENSAIVRMSLQGEEQDAIEIPLLAHDFVELPDGTIAAIAVEVRDDVRGNQIVEVAPGGKPEPVWSTWDCFDPATDVGDDPLTGWTFANALDYDEDEDAYYLGMRNLSGIVKISRQTGDCELVFGGASSTIDLSASSDRFFHQHQFEWKGDHVLVFDNDGAEGNVSRVLEYQVDLAQGTAEEVWQYTADPPVFSFVLGDVTRLEDGDTFVSWSVAGQMDRVTAERELRFRVNTELGYAFGFHSLLTSPYVPSP